MRRPNLILPSLVFFLVLPLATFGQSAADRVQRALDAQDKWLATQSTGTGWNQYLQTDELKAQLAKGDQADSIVVRKILSKYEAKQPGLRLPQLVSTRKAIAAWADQLHKPTPASCLSTSAPPRTRTSPSRSRRHRPPGRCRRGRPPAKQNISAPQR